MVFLNYQDSLAPQFKGFMKFLQSREGFKENNSRFFAKQMQDFNQSGMTPKEYFEAISHIEEAAAEKFLSGFRYYTEYTTNQYFEDFHKLRWELGRKHKKGGF